MTRRAGRRQVLLTRGAEHDLESLHAYLAERESAAAAHRLLDQIAQVVDTLGRFPDRGAHPPELLALGIRTFRQTGFKPYRVIYRVTGGQVIVHLIVDGRRDLQAVLARRLLGA
jgi:toxin ParE1/3/4